jgi:nitrilase
MLHHRKIMPTAVERVIWGCGDGSTLKVAQSSIGNIGTLICWENYMPLARMALYEQQVQLYCIPTVDDREAWIPTLRHIAREGRCFVLSACQFLENDAYRNIPDTRYLPDTPIRGGSCIVNPLGELVTQPLYNEAGLVFSELNMDEVTQGKYDLDVAGHYARPDIFEFKVRSK